MKQYSADLRERLLGAIDAGLPQAEAARLFGVGLSTIKRWRQRRQETGGVAASPRPGRSRRIGPEAEPALVAQVRAAPDATLAEHCARGRRPPAWPSARRRCRGRCSGPGWPLKKSRSSPPNATRPPARRGGPRSATLNPADLVFVDETSTHTAMTRRRARAPRGERASGASPATTVPT